ncbi:uncharacterized protein LAJ45_10078 [Morchella importuna]|uniref:uncharacterized protein n=1 Tax=Morchella importuna TaxID=1174673 RepID=UPI001E8E7FEF|nr:uncharacterized protein LAJ45_10078 [Morchella importuna]KAH8145936.1 hypothetical protein LAJ45_10078 [Morchella importuna]
MSRHAQIEEVSDSDPEDMDISLFDPRNKPTLPTTAPPYTPTPSTSGQPPSFNPAFLPTSSDPSTHYVSAGSATLYKSYHCLYPVYFDSTRSRSSGRRAPRALSIPNPLARALVDACASLRLKTVFEPGKTHPKDWANPGRVRVLLPREGNGATGDVSSKFVLYQKVGEWLVAHPTAPEDVLKVRIPGMPFDGKVPSAPEAPRGWKMGSVLPLHSAALSGGGVSDDVFGEMMRDMGLPGVAGPGAEGGEVVKKEKKEKKKKR